MASNLDNLTLSLFIAVPVALVLLALYMGLALRRFTRANRFYLRTQRVVQGYCPYCGYDLAGSIANASGRDMRGDPPPRCPECGRDFSEDELRQLAAIAPVLLRSRMDRPDPSVKTDG